MQKDIPIKNIILDFFYYLRQTYICCRHAGRFESFLYSILQISLYFIIGLEVTAVIETGIFQY
jgi:hypothetical protein